MLKYSKDHEWARIDGNKAVVGISEFAVHQLGDIVYVELPEIGAEFGKDDPFGNVESVKATSEMLMPLSGKVTAVNDGLEDTPELVNQSPQDKGWIIEIELTTPGEVDELMDEAAYKSFCEEEGH